GELLILAASLSRDVDDPVLVMPALSRLIPFDLPVANWLKGGAKAAKHPFPLDTKGIERWLSEYVNWLAPAPGELPEPGIADYERIADFVMNFFTEPARSRTVPADYLLLLRAARNELP